MHTVRSGERWQRPVVTFTHNSARELFSKALHCWYEKQLHLAATTCHPYRYFEHECFSVQRCKDWFGDTLSCRNFFQQSVGQEQLTSSNQPTNWNNNLDKIVMVIQLVSIEPFYLILGGSKNVCLSLNAVISVNIAWKGTRNISKFKLNIVNDTVTYLNVIALLLFKS